MMSPPAVTARPAVLAAAGAVLVLTGCGSDAADLTDPATSSTTTASPSETTTTPTTDATSPTSPPSPTEPTETATSPSGDGITGSGYSYAIPDGWEDVSKEATSSQADSAVRVSDAAGGFGTNVNVIVTPAAGIGDISSLRDTFARQIESLVDSKVQPIPDATIDGEQAIGQTATKRQNEKEGGDLVFTQYFVAHKDSIYAITLTAQTAQADSGRQALQTILTSWGWA